MIEEKIKKILVGATIIGSLMGLGGCGSDRVSCYSGGMCSEHTNSITGCGSGEICECSKPKGAPDSECYCDCVDNYNGRW